MKVIAVVRFLSSREMSRVYGLLISIIVAGSLDFAWAQGPISAVQEALKREQLLFGPTSGVFDDATRQALQLFQTRRGLQPTGELDVATLSALQGPSPSDPPAIESIPAGGVPASTVTAATRERDREFLRTLEAGQFSREEHFPPAPTREVSGHAATPVVSQGNISPDPGSVPPRPAAPLESSVRVAEPRKANASNDAVKNRRVGTVASRGRPQLLPEEFAQNPQEVRIRTTVPNRSGRTIIFEGRTYSERTAVPVRRALPVQPRRKTGFFDRIFNDDEDDD